MTAYVVFVATMAGIYALITLGLVAIWGQGGMVNLGLVGFYAVGAYGSALTSMTGLPIGVGLVTGALAAGLTGVAVSYITRPLRGDYLAIVSLGFAEVIRLVAMNEKWLTGGSNGLAGLRSPLKEELGSFHSVFYLLLVWVIVGAAAFALTRLVRSPFGRALRAVRDDEQVAAVAGKPVLTLKLKTFFVGAALTGLAGGLYAHFTSYIAPDGFLPLITIYIFLAAVAGGYTRVAGAIVGAVLITLLLESTRFLSEIFPVLSAARVAALREMSIAIALILIMQLRPAGLLASKIQPSRSS